MCICVFFLLFVSFDKCILKKGIVNIFNKLYYRYWFILFYYLLLIGIFLIIFMLWFIILSFIIFFVFEIILV